MKLKASVNIYYDYLLEKEPTQSVVNSFADFRGKDFEIEVDVQCILSILISRDMIFRLRVNNSDEDIDGFIAGEILDYLQVRQFDSHSLESKMRGEIKAHYLKYVTAISQDFQDYVLRTMENDCNLQISIKDF